MTYNEKVDVWSIGVITYMLLTGRNPYPGKTKQEVKSMIVNTEINYQKPFFKSISKEAINFLQMALTKSIGQRASAA